MIVIGIVWTKKSSPETAFGDCIGDETFAVLGFIKSEGTAKLAADVCILSETVVAVKNVVVFMPHVLAVRCAEKSQNLLPMCVSFQDSRGFSRSHVFFSLELGFF